MFLLDRNDIRRWLTQAKKGGGDRVDFEFVFTDHRRSACLEKLAADLRTQGFECRPVEYDGDGEAFLSVRSRASYDETELLALHSRFRGMAGTFRVEYLGIQVADVLAADKLRERHDRKKSEPAIRPARPKTAASGPEEIPMRYDVRKVPGPKVRPVDGWLVAVGGLCLVMFGLGLLWLNEVGIRETRARESWIRTEGLLKEVGIDYFALSRAARFKMLARYAFTVGGREYTGEWIQVGHQSGYLYGVREIVSEYAPEAARVEKEDFSFGQGPKMWQLPFPGTPVSVIYDPDDPARAELLLRNPLKSSTAPSFLIWGISLFLIFLGVGGVAVFVGGFFQKEERHP